MYQVYSLNKISPVGTDLFTQDYQKTEAMENADAILVRSAAMHDMEMPDSLLAIARAGAGVNNIPLEKCADQGIVVFNTPGANANGVKELTLCGMLMSCRDVLGGIAWAKTLAGQEDAGKQVEKGKGKFAGCELMGRKLGVIGLGAVGGPLANAALKLGMTVYGCDPYISVDAAWHLDSGIIHVKTREEIYENCDFISLHVPLLDSTKHMINAETIGKMKDGVVLLNFARDSLVDDDAMEAALASGKVRKYVTDFPNAKTAGMDGVIAIPHLGASTEESEDNCARMAVKQIMNYLENGNIVNSVNFPNCDMGICQSVGRITILHKNIPNSLGQFTAAVAGENVNIAGLRNVSRGEYAYTMLDVDSTVGEETLNLLRGIAGVLKVRYLK